MATRGETGTRRHYRIEWELSTNKSFREKSDYSQKFQLSRWLKRNEFVQRLATHESQKDSRVTVAETLDFLECQRPRLIEPTIDQDYLINMNQTPVPFTFNSKKTLEIFGMKTINVRKSTNDTKRATFAMTVTVSGKVLKPLLVFKGKPGGRIENVSFHSYHRILCTRVNQTHGWTKM